MKFIGIRTGSQVVRLFVMKEKKAPFTLLVYAPGKLDFIQNIFSYYQVQIYIFNFQSPPHCGNRRSRRVNSLLGFTPERFTLKPYKPYHFLLAIKTYWTNIFECIELHTIWFLLDFPICTVYSPHSVVFIWLKHYKKCRMSSHKSLEFTF